MNNMKVLSLFDGISCGYLALQRAGIPIETYYASEIDKTCIKVSQKHFPNIIQLGDVNNWRTWDIPWKDIDLVMGGFCCQSFSSSGKGKGFMDARGRLLFCFSDIVKHLRKETKGKVLFLGENVRMRDEHRWVITEELGVEPVEINGWTVDVIAHLLRSIERKQINDIVKEFRKITDELMFGSLETDIM